MNILVLGAPGSGKSFLSVKAKGNGLHVFDADYDVPGLCMWRNQKGKQVDFPESADVAWLDSHDFVWDEKCLKNFLKNNQPLIMFGIASNAFELSMYFDKTFYLFVNKDTLKMRLLNNTAERKNSRGKSESEVEQIWRDIQADHLPKVENYGITIIDSNKPADELLQEITGSE